MYLIITFLNPTVLWGLSLLAVPIIIHLFNFKRVRKVEFSNVYLLKKVKEESSAKRKPVELLILISRLLFLLLLVLAFAQPVRRQENLQKQLNNEVLVYLDNSLSMSVPAGSQQSALDQAFSIAYQVITSYPDDTQFRLLENNYGNSLNLSYSKNGIREKLTELESSNISRDLQEISDRIETSAFHGDIYLISDFQQNITENINGIGSDTLSSYYLVPVQFSEQPNVYFDSAYLENSFVLDGLKSILKVGIKNSGMGPVEGVSLKMYSEDQLTSTASISVPANGLVTHSFELEEGQENFNKVRLTLDDSPVIFDNALYLTLNTLQKIKVSEVKGANANNYIEKLYTDNTLFEFESFRSGNLDQNRLRDSDVIILNELESLSNQLSSFINTFLSGNGSVIVIPNEEAIPQEYSTLGASLGRGTREKPDMRAPDFNNPFFEGVFEENSERISMPYGTVNFRIRNEDLSLLSFKNNRSFLSKIRSDGNLYFFSSSFQKGVTNFPEHSLFVPVFYKLALGSKVNLSRLFFRTDAGIIDFSLSGDLNPRTIVKLRKNEQEITPDQRLVGDQLIMTVPKGEMESGHYDLLAEDEVIGVLAFNNTTKESELTTLEIDRLEDLTQETNVQLINIDDETAAAGALSLEINGKSFWKYALMLSLFFLFVEIILIRYL